jgi:HEAT repeat protein
VTRLAAIAVLVLSAGYLLRAYLTPPPAPPPPPPPSAAQEAGDALPVLSPREIERVRASLKDQSPDVRWAAVRLLHGVHDPQLDASLREMLARDPDPDLRVKIVGLLGRDAGDARLATLIQGLDDADPSVRVASLKAIGEIGDPSATPWVVERLRDAEPDVRIEALKTLGRFQDKRKAEYRAMAKELRKDYEAALKHKSVE